MKVGGCEKHVWHLQKIKIMMKKYSFILLLLLLFSCGKEEKRTTSSEITTTTKPESLDKRISLNLPPHKAQHQLENMRGHLVAIQSIITHLSNNQFEEASDVASSQLGLTQQMKMMCSSFGNKKFEQMGLEFHKKADEMSVIFKNKNKEESLNALSNLMNSCIQCHANFKQ